MKSRSEINVNYVALYCWLGFLKFPPKRVGPGRLLSEPDFHLIGVYYSMCVRMKVCVCTVCVNACMCVSVSLCVCVSTWDPSSSTETKLSVNNSAVFRTEN